MTPQEAQYRIRTYGDQAYVPPLYRQMTPTELQTLVDECNKPSPEQRLADIPVPRLNYNPLDRLLGRETPRKDKDETPPPAAAPANVLPTVLEKALANPRRMRTPSRQRTAFLCQLERCGSVAEAAARAGVNRGTLYRWKARDRDFARRWTDAIARHTEAVADDIALQASQIEVQPIFYRGQKIGERRRINTRLLIHVQNRLDAERRRAEDRAERRELLLLRAELAQRNRETSQPATLAATAAKSEMCCGDLGLADVA